jgi:methylmalonyl-CoA/ethylmalonyl-CoA epimerase
MILRIDHVGIVARSFDEATDLLLDTFGFSFDAERTPMPYGSYMAPENCVIYFITVGGGDTRLELLLPRDQSTGMGRWLEKHGPSVHHLAYLVDDVAAHAAELRGRGLEQIDMGPGATAAFFYPRSTMGILTELVDARTMERVHVVAATPDHHAHEPNHPAHHDLERRGSARPEGTSATAP